ncbi:MAG TPA: ATP-binding protein, partial [Magnetospirillum sp.]|nr:ATP-binding protein [Magnetospirillum sp.]
MVTAGVIVAGSIFMLTWQRRQHQRRQDSQNPLNGIADALNRCETWHALRQASLIDGHALWDANERLIDSSGILREYLPQLDHWRTPTADQVIAALVDGGKMELVPGVDRAQTIEVFCRLRRKVPGLRHFRMTDGRVLLARTIDLGNGSSASIFTDVTELRAVREGIVGDEAFRQIFDQHPNAKLLLDAQMRPLVFNHAFTTLLGHSLEQLSRLGWSGLLHPDEPADLPPWTPGIRRLITADGGSVRADIGMQSLGGEHNHVLITVVDVTSRWEADERLRLQAAVLQHASTSVLAVDRAGRVVFGNPAALSLFQWSDQVLPGTPVERLLGAAVRTALDDGAVEVESEGTTWNGTCFPAQVAIGRIGEGTPLPGGAVLVVADLTPRRALDLQMMHSARLATLGEMAASIAHEFNQCLHVIRLASEAVQLDIGDGRLEPARLTKRTENILAQVDRLTEMVTHMRAISRRECQEKRPFEPQVAVDAALRMVEPLLKVDGIQVVRQGRLGGIAVLGHQVRLEQVLLNLLNNGRDAIRERFRREGNTGGRITITCTPAEAGDVMSIAVRDTGTGIPNAIGHHIFEPFITTKEGGHGLGLGLSISRGICTEMGGSLTFRNVEDGGAEFVIDLPVAALAVPERAPSAPPPPAGWDDTAEDDEGLPEERRVLLVDDEALSVMMVSEFLQRQGFVVDTAYDGVEAYELCLIHVYHAVITDIRMPRMNGRELIAKLHDLQPGTPVIVVT